MRAAHRFSADERRLDLILPGIDPQTKKFTQPPEQIKNEIAALKANKSISAAQKKGGLAQLEAALKIAKPIQFKENIALAQCANNGSQVVIVSVYAASPAFYAGLTRQSRAVSVNH